LVELDQNAATRIKKESPLPSAFVPEPESADGGSIGGEGEGVQLNREQSRAAAFLLLLTLVNGKSKIRLWVRIYFLQQGYGGRKGGWGV